MTRRSIGLSDTTLVVTPGKIYSYRKVVRQVRTEWGSWPQAGMPAPFGEPLPVEADGEDEHEADEDEPKGARASHSSLLITPRRI
jgi:hypothetical protein